MEQQEIVAKLYLHGIPTVEKLMRVCCMVFQSMTVLPLGNLFEKKIVEGENHVYDLINNQEKTRNVLLDKRVDLTKFREVLNDYHVSFAFQQESNGVRMYFRAKDSKIMEHAMQDILKDILQKPEKTHSLLKKSTQMNHTEKMAYYNQQYYRGNLSEFKPVVISKGVN